MDFINRFIDFTKAFESPTSFWRWSAYALIAATLRDNCYYHHGLFKTYPNIYVILLAESAEYRKGGPCKPVSQLIRTLHNTKIIEGRASVQGIIDKLSQDIGTKNGQPLRGGSCILLADELASFFVQDPALIPLITTMYDYKDEYPYSLRSSEIVVKNLCLTMLAASNSEFLRTVYTTAAKFGGLLGRTFMVKPDETRPGNDLMDVDISLYDYKPLVDYLLEIRKLKGRITATDEAKSLYKEWYATLYKSYKQFPDATGLTQRIHTGVLKLAIILAASDLMMEIQLKHMEEAIGQVVSLRSNYEGFAMSAGRSDKAAIGAIVLNALWEAKDKQLTRQKIMFNHWNDFTATELDELITTLEQAGMISTIAEGNQVSYKMTQKCIEKFNKG